jgi:hypothetical protein
MADKLAPGTHIQYKKWDDGAIHKGVVTKHGWKWITVRDERGKEDWGWPDSAVLLDQFGEPIIASNLVAATACTPEETAASPTKTTAPNVKPQKWRLEADALYSKTYTGRVDKGTYMGNERDRLTRRIEALKAEGYKNISVREVLS